MRFKTKSPQSNLRAFCIFSKRLEQLAGVFTAWIAIELMIFTSLR